MTDPITVTMVNHVAIDFAVSPDRLWRKIVDDYALGKRFREQGNVEPVDDPAALLGGYRFRIEQDGAVDERIVHVTERDEAARRLSLFVTYLSVPNGLQVHATYQAHETLEGARFTIDCHSRLGLDLPADGEKADLAAALSAVTAKADAHMISYLEGLRPSLETGD